METLKAGIREFRERLASYLSSVITSKPASHDQVKTGHVLRD